MTANPSPLDDDRIREQTRQVVQAYHLAWKARDVEAIVALFHEQIQYHEYSAQRLITHQDIHDYIKSTVPTGQGELLQHHDRIRVDGHTAFMQYELIINGAGFRCSEALRVQDGKVIEVHDYAVLMRGAEKAGKSQERSATSRLGLSPRQLAILAQDLEHYFQHHKPYLNSELNLQQVADASGYSRNQISYFLNNVLGQSFYQYIQQVRIEHVLGEMAKGPVKNVEKLALDSGFNSMSAFYKHFRRVKGLSPKAYLKQLHHGASA